MHSVRDYERSIVEAEGRRVEVSSMDALGNEGSYDGAEAEASCQLEGSESSLSEAEVRNISKKVSKLIKSNSKATNSVL